MSVADNLYIGREPRRFGMIDRKRMVRDADALMRNYGFALMSPSPLATIQSPCSRSLPSAGLSIFLRRS